MSASTAHQAESAAEPSPGTAPSLHTLRRWKAVTLLTSGLLLGLLLPTTAQGIATRFSDVPSSHPFFDEIEWMDRTGITEGFPDGTFRPTQPVTRQSMAAFMQRLYNQQEETSIVGSAASSLTSSTSWVDLPGSTSIVASPEGSSVLVAALFTAESDCVGAGGWCEVRMVVDPPGATGFIALPPASEDAAFDSSHGGDAWESHAIQGYLSDYGAGTYTVKVQYRVASGAAGFALDDWVLRVDTDLMNV